MLCKSCEQQFSTWEKAFAEKCFVPLNSGNARDVRYGPWMLKFASSPPLFHGGCCVCSPPTMALLGSPTTS